MLRLLLAALLCATSLSAARAQSADAFYRSNKITILVGSEPGGSLSTYANLVSQHMRKFLPGEPAIISQHMPGAGGVVAAINFANTAPKDGTVILLPVKDIAFSQAIDSAPKYDAETFNWLGRMVGYPAVIMVAARTGVKSIEDLKTKKVIIAGSGGLAQSTLAVELINHLLGTKMSSTSGYRGGPEMFLAMERGEADGRIAPPQAVEQQKPDWVKSKFVNYIAQEGFIRTPGVDAPLIADLVSDPAGKAMVRLLDSGSMIGFSLATQGGVPADRVAVLRDAFTKMMADKDFQAQAQKTNSDLDYLSGAELTAFVKEVAATPKETVQQFRKVTGVEK